MLSAILIALWVVELIYPAFHQTTSLIVSNFAGSIALLTFVIAMTTYFFAGKYHSYGFTLLTYILLSAMAATAVYSTGASLQSPFVVLWLIIGMLAGVFGPKGLVMIASTNICWLIAAIYLRDMTSSSVVTSVVTLFIPLIVSTIIWRGKTLHDTSKDNEINELTRELSQTSSKAETVIQSIADGVVVVDSRGVISMMNPAAYELAGWHEGDAIKLDYRSVIKLADTKNISLEDASDPVQQVLAGNETIARDDLLLVTRAGKRVNVSLHVSLLGSEGAGVIIIFRDITNLVLENRQKAEFISTASHEMRTPVAAIEGYLSLALNPSTGAVDERARGYLQKAHESVQHLGQLFQDLLDVSKADGGRINNNPVILEAITTIRSIVQDFVLHAKQNNLALVYEPDVQQQKNVITPVCYINVDPHHLREVVGNLIENALKYTKEGTITVSVGVSEEFVTIGVQDTGIGIPEEDIRHLFEKFYRVDNSETREIGGTGLGLYLCRRLTEAIGGRIWVESSYGTGSHFFIEIPRLPYENAVAGLTRPRSQ
ncbi:MAG: ATP-binding protein [Candidatus Saccharimonadales bacterium]